MSGRDSPRVNLWKPAPTEGQDAEIKNNLYAISIDQLYDGMEMQGDVYASDAERLLLKGGTLINKKILNMLTSFNNGSKTIYVSENAFRWLNDQSAQTEAVELQELEASTGYVDIKDETLELLDEVSHEQVVKQDVLYSISDRLSATVEQVKPSRILSLINALAPVDEYLQRHSINVSLLNGLVGKWSNMSKEVIDRLVLIGLLHDCGKALVPPQVLNAPRKLSAAEFEVMKMHPIHGYELLVEFPESVRRAVRGHHEKFNARGYPDGISAEAISLEARITAISDIYDSLVSQRVYKGPKSPFSVLAMLSGFKDSEIDGMLTELFIQNMPKELLKKEVMMSNGDIGIVHSIDPDNIEYPFIVVRDNVMKSHKNWYCVSMYTR